jgi:hypothetical protein
MTDAPGPGAASVAAQLLEFLREPARVRPLYLHAQQPLPEGNVVLKFALGRFPSGWQRDLPRHEQDEILAAARAFVRQVCLRDRATHYQVLCLGGDATSEAIKENYRLLMALLHPDRQDAAAHEWPMGCAQRVNEAYAVLCDAARRAEYDQELQRVRVPPSFEPHITAREHGGAHTRRQAILRPFLIVTSVVAAIFVVQAWWVADIPSHYSLLERASPMRASAQWMRDSLPRFMGSKPAFFYEPLEAIAPSSQPYKLATMQVPEPARVIEAAPVVTIEPRAPMETPRTPPPVMVASATTLPRESVPLVRLAQVGVPAGAAATPPATNPRTPATPSTEEVEIMVARLVGFYEGGDADGLMSLFDPDELGFWKGMRVRNAYTDFFRATRQRRLRVDRLTWKSGPQSASAQGDATLVADFVDNRSRLERKVDLDLEVAMRNGQARLTRLTLYPDAR